MPRFASPSTTALVTVSFTLLAACSAMPGISGISGKPATPAAAGASTVAAPAPSGLADGIALYNKGDYNGAIRRLGQPDVSGPATPRATQTAALKYSAFSYCLTARQTQCRQQFDKALKIDPAFDLEAGEHGHPLWEPVFAKAKKGLK